MIDQVDGWRRARAVFAFGALLCAMASNPAMSITVPYPTCRAESGTDAGLNYYGGLLASQPSEKGLVAYGVGPGDDMNDNPLSAETDLGVEDCEGGVRLRVPGYSNPDEIAAMEFGEALIAPERTWSIGQVKELALSLGLTVVVEKMNYESCMCALWRMDKLPDMTE